MIGRRRWPTDGCRRRTSSTCRRTNSVSTASCRVWAGTGTGPLSQWGGHRHWPPQSVGRAQALAHSVSGAGTGTGPLSQWGGHRHWPPQSVGRAQALAHSVSGAGTGTGPLSQWGGHRHWPTQSVGRVAYSGTGSFRHWGGWVSGIQWHWITQSLGGGVAYSGPGPLSHQGGHRHWSPQSLGRAQALAHSVIGAGTGTGPLSHWGGWVSGIQWQWIIQSLGWVGEWHTVALDHSVTGVGG